MGAAVPHRVPDAIPVGEAKHHREAEGAKLHLILSRLEQGENRDGLATLKARLPELPLFVGFRGRAVLLSSVGMNPFEVLVGFGRHYELS